MTDPALRRATGARSIVLLLAMSAGCLALAPLLMPESYSIMRNAVSESAAQNVEGAWLARLGFLLLGFGVLGLARVAPWNRWAALAHRGYGVSIIAAAAFSHAPWEDVPHDRFEDFLHSVAAGAVGFTFTVGVVLVAIGRRPDQRMRRTVDWIAFIAAIVIPLTMFNVTEIAGLVQRIMFGIGYVWYGMEAAVVTRAPTAADAQSAGYR